MLSSGKEFGWAPEAFDEVFGHHVGSEAAESANKVLESFRALSKKATDERASSLYSLLLEQSSLGYVDHLLEVVVADGDLDAE